MELVKFRVRHLSRMDCIDYYWTVDTIEKVLETYSLEEIMELNDLTDYDVLSILVEEGHVSLPERLPVDYHDPSF